MNIIELTKGDNTMRNIDVIKAEISKLEAELADAVSHDKMRTAAVHIVRNLGWEWDNKLNQWRSPKKERDFKVFDQNTSTHIKAGDWVRIDTGFTGGYGFVRKVEGPHARVSFIGRVTPLGASVQESSRLFHHSHLKVVSHEEIMKNFK